MPEVNGRDGVFRSLLEFLNQAIHQGIIIYLLNIILYYYYYSSLFFLWINKVKVLVYRVEILVIDYDYSTRSKETKCLKKKKLSSLYRLFLPFTSIAADFWRSGVQEKEEITNNHPPVDQRRLSFSLLRVLIDASRKTSST